MNRFRALAVAALAVAALPGTAAASNHTNNAQPELVFSPLSFDFGEVAVGDSEDATLTVTNEGGRSSAEITVSLDSGAFSLVADGCSGAALPSGRSCEVVVSYSPGSQGAIDGATLLATTPLTDATAELAGSRAVSPALARFVASSELGADNGTLVGEEGGILTYSYGPNTMTLSPTVTSRSYRVSLLNEGPTATRVSISHTSANHGSTGSMRKWCGPGWPVHTAETIVQPGQHCVVEVQYFRPSCSAFLANQSDGVLVAEFTVSVIAVDAVGGAHAQRTIEVIDPDNVCG